MDANICPYIERHPETDFYIFYPPYSILFWNDVLQENHMEATMREYEYISKRLTYGISFHILSSYKYSGRGYFVSSTPPL